MAMWERSLSLQGTCLEKLKRLYSDRFPLPVRHYLAGWIESQPWDQVDPNNQLLEPQARLLFDGLLHALQQVTVIHPGQIQLHALYTHMEYLYSSRPLELVRVVQECLREEAGIIKEQECMQWQIQHAPLTKEHLVMVQAIQGAENSLHQLKAFLGQLCASIEVVPHNDIEANQQMDTEQLKTTSIVFFQVFKELMDRVGQLKGGVVGELTKWKEFQQRFKWSDEKGRGQLNGIQTWFEILLDLTWRGYALAKQFDAVKVQLPEGVLEDSADLAQDVTKQLLEIIQKSFVVEKQPPQVIKKETKFAAIVRMLLGSKMQVHLTIPEVSVTIVNESQAQQSLEEPNVLFPSTLSCGTMLNNQKTLEYNVSANILSSTFTGLQLQKIERTSKDRKTIDTVMEEKFALLFQTHFKIEGELQVVVRQLSLPVVVIVHTNQQPQAEATVFWDNAFADPNRTSFSIPDEVPWPRLAQGFSDFFFAHCGCGLTEQQLDYLSRKLLGKESHEKIDDVIMNKHMLFKEIKRGQKVTLWEWIFKNMDFVRSTLSKEWSDRAIHGFIDRTDTHSMLLQSQPGTFLIRFSEREPGGVSVSWVKGEVDPVIGQQLTVIDLKPWHKRDLEIRPLSDRINDLKHLTFLYPNIPKDEVFQKYYSAPISTERTRDGYVPTQLQASLPWHFVPNTDGYFISELKTRLPADMMEGNHPGTPYSLHASSFHTAPSPTSSTMSMSMTSAGPPSPWPPNVHAQTPMSPWPPVGTPADPVSPWPGNPHTGSAWPVNNVHTIPSISSSDTFYTPANTPANTPAASSVMSPAPLDIKNNVAANKGVSSEELDDLVTMLEDIAQDLTTPPPSIMAS